MADPPKPPNGVYLIGGQWYDGNGNWIDPSASTGAKYREAHLYGGPDGPGTYSVDEYGNPIALVKPDSSGGGGATIGYSQQTDADGSVTGTPGAIYQRGSNGAITVIYRPPTGPTGPDADGDGYDDSTGLPVGVVKVSESISPTGLVYQGKPVNPDGSLYTGGAAADLKTVTMYGSQGQGLYVVDGQYNVVKYLGPTTASGAGSSGSSGTSLGSFGSGGSSSSSAYNAAQDLYNQDQTNQQKIELLKAQNKENLAYQASLAALKAQYDNSGTIDAAAAASLAQREREFEKTFGLSLQQFQYQQQRDREQQQAQDIRDFRDAVSDVDPAKYRAQLFAQGLGAGGNIANRISEGENFLSDNANAGAAALLARIRGGYQNQYAQMAGLPPANTGGGTSAAGVDPSPASAPGSPNVPTPAADLPTNPNQIEGDWALQVQPGFVSSSSGQVPMVWKNRLTKEIIPWQQGDLTGPTPRVLTEEEQRQQLLIRQGLTGGYGGPSDGSRSVAAPMTGGLASYVGRTLSTDALGQQSGTQVQTIDPNAYGYQAPGSAATWPTWAQPPLQQQIFTDYGNPGDQLDPRLYAPDGTPNGIDPKVYGYPADNTAVPGGPITGDQSGAWVSTLPTRAVIPQLAMGGLAKGAMIVGDRPDGRPTGNEELVIAPQGARVIPLDRPQAARLMGGLPRYAAGTEGRYVSGRYYAPGEMTPDEIWAANKPAPTQQPTQPTQPAPYTAPTQPAQQPVAATPTQPASQPTPYTAPVAQPAQPVDTPTQPVQQPAQQPATPAQVAPQITPPAATSTGIQTIINGGLPTASGVVNVGNLDPESQALLDEINQWRLGQRDEQFASLSPYSLALGDQGPTFQQGYFQNAQTVYGAPAADFAYEAQKWRPRGLSREAILAGTRL